MLKKMLIAAVAVLVGLAVVSSPTWLGSLLRTKWRNCQAWVQEQVPLETEIQRIRGELARMTEDTRCQYDALAREMVAVEDLKADIATGEASLAERKKHVLSLRDDLANGRFNVKHGEDGRSVLKGRLVREFETYKACEENLKAKRKLLEARETGLSAAQEQLKALRETREQLKVELARLEAEVKTLRVAQTRSKVTFDEGQLSAVKQDLARLKNRVRVQQRVLDLQGQDANQTAVGEQVNDKDVIKEVDSRLGKTGDKVAVEK
jgi:chromosome segregation ATPase